MRKKLIAILMSLIMLVTLFASQLSAFAADSSIKVQFNNGGTSTTSNTIYAKFKVTNTGNSALNLADLKLRYYYTADAEKSQNFWCDHAGMMNGSNYVTVTDKVTGTFTKMTQTTSTADTYLEVGFKSGSGSVGAGESIEIQTRIARNDWTTYDQSNDYSYKSTGTYLDWDQVTAYQGGILVFGKEPVSGPLAPSINPKTATFDKFVPKDVTVTLTPNGNNFNTIKDLTLGSDYTISENTVTILKSYLSTLAVGTKTLTFDFGVTNNPTLVLTIKDSTPSTDSLGVSIGTATGNTGDTVTVPITFANVAKVGNVGTFNFYVNYDTTALEALSVSAGAIVKNSDVNLSTKINAGTISFVFLDNTIGDELITSDGVVANITFKILGAAGTTTPVAFKTGGAFGDGNMAKITKLTFTDGSVTVKTGTLAPSINPITAIFDKYVPKDVTVTLTPNGNNFNTIKDLTLGSDYTISGNTVTILTSYLSTLAVGTKTLTFDFGVTNNPTLALTIKDSTPSTDSLGVSIGTATGNTGDTVTVPITFADVAKVGNVGTFNFYVNYDTTALEAVSVSAGDIVKNSAVNLSTKINAGTISFVFLDNTIGDELITSDGIVANITFKILGAAGTTTPVAFKTGGAFGDGNMAKITKLTFTDGSVTVKTGTLSPSITPTSTAFIQGSASDLIVTLTPNGNTFSGITSLTQGIDYTVSGNTATILKSYLNSLAVGTKTLTFDFGVTSNPVLTVTVNPLIATPPSISLTTATFDKYVPSDITVTLTPNGNTFSGIANLTKGTDYTVSGNTVTILKSYLSTLAVGTKTLTFDFGVTSNPVLTVTVSDSTPVITGLGVTIGTASGKTGDTITVPITMKNVAKMGNVGTFNCYLSYDATLLEAVSVSAGDIVVNPAVNLSKQIKAGTISLVFLDNTIGDELITTDGVLATITFKIIGTSNVTTPVAFKTGGAFGNGNMAKITDVTFTAGSVKLN